MVVVGAGGVLNERKARLSLGLGWTVQRFKSFLMLFSCAATLYTNPFFFVLSTYKLANYIY